MALRPLYAPVVNRTLTFMAGMTDEMVKEALALTKIPMEAATIDRSKGDVMVTLNETVTIPENQKIQVPEHIYTWVK